MDQPIAHGQVLENLEAAGVRMHVYSILGFPTETVEEITRTRDFLLHYIHRLRYLTVSANLFYLMRGSAIAADPEAFNIRSVVDPGDVALVLPFVEHERAQSEGFATHSAQELYQAVFLPGLEQPEEAEGFWHFIDQTGIFYVQKVVHAKNPYHELAEKRAGPVPSDFPNRRYAPSRLFWLDSPVSGQPGALCDWVTMNYVQTPSWIRDFLCSLDPTKTLIANVDALLSGDRQAVALEAFPSFVKAGLAVEEGRPAGEHGPPANIFD